MLGYFILTKDGEIRLAGIFTVRRKGNYRKGYWKNCGKIDPQYGIMFVEAMLFAIDRINNDNTTLYGLKMRARIHDTCGDKSLLRHALARIADWQSQGVVGPLYSDDAKTAATVMTIFGKNTVSYSATSPDLENREHFGYFYRTVPSDRNAVRLLLSIALKFKWRYIAMISSHGNYGERCSDLFRKAAKAQKICIPVDIIIPEHSKTDDYKFALNKILKIGSIRVVYLFLIENDLIQFFQIAENMKNKTGHLQFVVSDGWGSRAYIAPDKTVANGSITFQVETEEVKEFRDYFLNLKPATNTRNIWFNNFWEETFNCAWKNDSNVKKMCTGNEKLKQGQGYYSNTPVLSVINAVYAYAYAFRKTIWYECIQNHKTAKYCTKNDKMLQHVTSYPRVLYYVKRTEFKEPFRIRTFSFTSAGDQDENYELLNYHFQNDGNEPVLRKIGTWNNIHNKTTLAVNTRLADSKPLEPESWRLQIDIDRIVWKNQSSTPISVCSNPCDFGYVRSQQTMCCWTCLKCKQNDVTTNDTCRSCDLDHIPDSVRQTCKALEIKYIGMYPNIARTVLSVSGIGVLLTVAVVALFAKNINRRIIKASSRELCLNMLFGIALVFASPIIFILRPSFTVCTFQRLIIGISFTACYAPLLLRTNRIYRIFRSAKSTVTRPMMISPRSQIFMSAALTAIGILIGVVSIVGRSSDIQTAYPSHRQFIVRYCKIKGETMILNLSFSSMLMIVTTWFAFKTRNFPKNYNEAKYIGLTMYATCLVLAVFLPIFYFVDDSEGRYRTLILCCVCFINAAINLVGLFGTKVWILIWKDSDDVDVTGTTMMNSTTINVRNHRIAVTFDLPSGIRRESDIKTVPTEGQTNDKRKADHSEQRRASEKSLHLQKE
eukprot:Seg734.17 transcript_id=Seg734.17/GoldUCD/mRNA.D3Y31 product="Metabotropic glutamate receptor 3" protein_id=Seg734.17/GoldUCD/D3Y31